MQGEGSPYPSHAKQGRVARAQLGTGRVRLRRGPAPVRHSSTRTFAAFAANYGKSRAATLPAAQRRVRLLPESNSGRRSGGDRCLSAGQSRLKRRFLGVVERRLHHRAALALEALEHLVRGDLAHQHE